VSRSPSDFDDQEEGGGYLVSVSDLMIGLLFVFLLMLMAFALQYRSAEQEQQDKIKQEDVRAQTAERQLASERRQVGDALRQEIDRVRDALTREQRLRDAMLRTLQDRLQREGIEVQMVPESGVLRLKEGVLFGSMQSDLADRPDAAQPSRLPPREVVRHLAVALADTVPCYAESGSRPADCPPGSEPILESVFVEGHTDSRVIAHGGPIADNYQLSTERALTTYRTLLADRPSLSDLKSTLGERLFGLAGYGPDRPVQRGAQEQDMAANRRIDLRFLLATPPPEQLEALSRKVDAMTVPTAP
jgi:flagellar motor protein MotB